MLSKYFKFKTAQKNFDVNAENIKTKFAGKRILICGETDGFAELDKKYKFSESFEIVAFVPSVDSRGLKRNKKLRIINYQQIPNFKYDAILITSENPLYIKDLLIYEEKLQQFEYELLFKEEIEDEYANMTYLFKYNIENRLKDLKKKLGDKRIVLYGGGLFLRLIHKYFDLSEFNIIGIADKKYNGKDDSATVCGYKLYSPAQIASLNPDYVLITTRIVVAVVDDLYFNYLKDTGIKIMSIIKKGWIRTILEG